MLPDVHPEADHASAGRSAGPAWEAPWPALLVALAVAIAYSTSFGGPFQFDDRVVIVGEPAITGFHLDAASRRFLGDLSFALSYRLFGDEPVGYHAVNVAIHLANALLVFWVAVSLLRTDQIRRALPARRGTAVALLASLLFAVHPLQTQAVTYIAQRYASLAAAFFLLATGAYVRFRLAPSTRASSAWYALFLAASAAALWTKENTYVLPLAILLVELVFFSAPPRRRLLFLSPFLLGASAVVGLTLVTGLTLDRLDAATRLGTDLSRHDYALTQLRVVAAYLRLLAVPVGQNIDHDVAISSSLADPGVLPSALLHACLLAGAALALLRGRRKDALWSLVGFGILWFYVTLLVESSLFPIVDVMFEHRVYLPSMGIFVAVAALLARVRVISSPRAWIAATAALTMSLAALTIARNRVWGSDFTLWADAASKSPNKPRPLNNLGNALLAGGDARGAIAAYERAIQADPLYVKAYFNLGEALQKVGEHAAAILAYERFLAWEPRYPDTYRNLAECYRKTGQPEAATRLDSMYERITREAVGALPPSLR